MDLKFKYESVQNRRDLRHIWSVVGPAGGIHFWAEKSSCTEFGREYYGGVEIHYRKPPEYMDAESPTHDECWLLGQACWHDGSSLYAQEVWIPFWLAFKGDNEMIFRKLKREYEQRFTSELVNSDP